MPRLNGRYDHAKVYRPRGTKFAEGEAGYFLKSGGHLSETTFVIGEAFRLALLAFYEEFGDIPDRERMVVEAVYDSRGVKMTVYELPKTDEE